MVVQSSDSYTNTIAAIATASGRGSVGIIRLSGDLVLDIAQQLQGQPLKPRLATLCNFLGADGQPIDQGILIYYPKPASYTGEHVIEIQAHGGQVVMNMLLERTIELGARLARPGEFTERAFNNNKLDLLQAEAVSALINSASSQAARSAMRSLQGKFSDHIAQLLQTLTQLRVRVESILDFPEEDVDALETAHIHEQLETCLQTTRQINHRAGHGATLNRGQQAVIIGSSNVGKSTLFNRLVGKDVAITSNTLGTTRDLLEQTILIAGAPLNLIDTAGLRESIDDVEQQGIQRALKAIKQADILLLILEEEQPVEELLSNGFHNQFDLGLDEHQGETIIVRNKIDLAQQSQALLARNYQQQDIYLSAKTGQGMQYLMQRLTKLMGLNDNGEDSYMARTRHLEALSKIGQHLSHSLEQLQQQGALELVAEDLRQAQQILGEITGSFVADDLLGEIFSTFCIGK